MRRRGRPPSPDLLTPREIEVLALVRQGLSNRAISERLGISLRGTKYHVTEILSKLGVTSREEAAQWTPEKNRNWTMLWPASLVTHGREVAASFVTPKLTGVGLVVPIALGGLVVVGLSASGGLAGGASSSRLAAVEPTPTPTVELPPICEQVACMTLTNTRTQVASLEDAASLATFTPRLPGYIPAGFEERTLMHSRPDFPSATSDPYYDKLWATYSSDDGRVLSIQQGYYSVAPSGWYQIAPEGMRGTVTVEGRELRWVRGGPKATTRWELTGDGGARPIHEGWNDGGLVLFWTISLRDIGAWEVTPDGEYRSASRPLEYAISSDSLPLEELVKIAESVLQ